MKKLLSISLAALALTAGAASAADLPNRKQAPAPYVAAPSYNWSGSYIGINAGYGFGSFSGAAGSQFKNPSNFVGGGQIGFNQQLANKVVVGVEGDFDYSGLQGKATSTGTAGSKARLDTLGTVRGRLGYAMDRVMPYITAGYAGGNEKITIPGSNNSSGWRNGYAVGAGIDYALTNNVSARVEGLYVSLENKNTAVGKVGNDLGIVRTALNYKF